MHNILASYFISICRHAFFTTEFVNDGKKQWLTGLMRSLQKYNLYCHATESQIQSYLMRKYEAFLEEERTEDDWPLRLAANVVGLQKINPEDPIVQETGMDPTIRVWVLNSQVQISEIGTLIDPATSPFVWIDGQRRTQSGSQSIARHKFASTVCPIDPDRSALRNAIQVMQRAFLNNFPSSILVISSPPAKYSLRESVAGSRRYSHSRFVWRCTVRKINSNKGMTCH